MNIDVKQQDLDCKGNPNSLDEQLFSQDLARGNPKSIYK
jgi:hypothetical protein